ncbi:30S ribosomal protein S18 [Candidatus Parcubacteria bacterium]|nr:30S ribosomal protein S18 [Candidatus Parcubacteria bacterium]
MKQDYFTQNNIKHIDFRDIDILGKFINPSGRIQSRRRTGLTAKNQRRVAEAIKHARFMSLMAYVAE